LPLADFLSLHYIILELVGRNLLDRR